MLNFKKNETRFCVGIDFGTKFTKVIEAVFGSQKPSLINVFKVPSNSRSEADILTEVKKSLASQSQKDARISVQGPDVTVRFINMPKMNEQDLKQSIKFEADKHIPFDINEVFLDSCILDEKKSGPQMDVLLAAVKKDIILKKINALKESAFDLKIVDIDSFSLFNCFCSNNDVEKDKSTAFINLGHAFTNVMISKGKIPFFIRDIQMGGLLLEKNLSQGLSIKASESAKLMSEITNPEHVSYPVLKESVDKIVDEVRLSFAYYENQFGSSVEKIYISGGLVNSKIVRDIIEEDLGLKLETWNPFDAFDTSGFNKSDLPERDPFSFAVCSGLLLRQADF